MSTHTASPATASGSPYYVWEVPDRVTVRLHYDVIDRILPEVMRGFGALPRRGAEVGGLLIGQVLSRSPLVVSVEDVEPIACEYLTGPSYRLSPKDIARLEEALDQWQDRPLQVVGMFRSHTRKDLFLDEQDFALIQRYFDSSTNVFLCVKPFATRASVAGFFFWENGRIQLDAPHSQFPFHRRELGGGDNRAPTRGEERRAKEEARAPERAAPRVHEDKPERKPPPVRLEAASITLDDRAGLALKAPDVHFPSPSGSPTVVFESAAARYDVKPEPAPILPPPPSSIAALYQGGALPFPDLGENLDTPVPKSRTPWLIAALGILLCVGSILLYRALSQSPSPDASAASMLPLGLAIQQNGTQLDVSWNREAPSIKAAQRGILEIDDGGAKQQLALTAGQLRRGLVRYTRLTGQVNLRLEVFATENASVSESARVLAPGSETAAQPQPEPPVEVPSVHPVSPPTAATSEPVSKPPVEVSEPVPVRRPESRPRTVRSSQRLPERTETAAQPKVEPVAAKTAEEAPRELPRPARRR